MDRNQKLKTAIAASSFGNVSRLAKHLGVHYRNIDSYVILERRPVDNAGIVKHDAAAICNALEASLEDLFPAEFIDHPYSFRESYEDGYGQRSQQVLRQKYFAERDLSSAQASAVLKLLKFADAAPSELANGFTRILIRDLKPDEFAAIKAAHLKTGEVKPSAGIYRQAIKRLNAPVNLKRLQALRKQSEQIGTDRALTDLEAELRAYNRMPLTDDLRQELVGLRDKTGLGAVALFDWAARRGITPVGKGVSAQALDNALSGRSDTISEVLLEFAKDVWGKVIERV